MQAQTSQQCVVVSFDTYCMNARGKINIYDIPILSFNISLDNPNLANLVSRHLCKNNAISKVLNKLQIFHFCSTVHTSTTPTVITHSCVWQKPPSCNDNGYKFEFKICNRHVSKILAKKSEMLKL